MQKFIRQHIKTIMLSHSLSVRCMRQRKCRSINYNLTSSLCELNNASYISAPGDLHSGEGVVHFAVEEWPQVVITFIICFSNVIC